MNRRGFLKSSLALTILSVVTMTGCKTISSIINQSTLASLVSTVGVGVVNLLNFLGMSALATSAQALFQQAVTDIKGWTPGTAATEIINALTDILNFIAALPGIPSNVLSLISLAVSTIESIISLFQQNAPVNTSAVKERSPKLGSMTKMANPPMKASDFRHVWNGLSPSGARID
jgi:hypothetical protein